MSNRDNSQALQLVFQHVCRVLRKEGGPWTILTFLLPWIQSGIQPSHLSVRYYSSCSHLVSLTCSFQSSNIRMIYRGKQESSQ